MKNKLFVICFLAVLTTTIELGFHRLSATEVVSPARYEYATIGWGGRDGTQVIRPGAKVELVGAELSSVKKPDRTDERSFYMNLVLNALAKEGYEFAGMTSDEIIMKRSTTH